MKIPVPDAVKIRPDFALTLTTEQVADAKAQGLIGTAVTMGPRASVRCACGFAVFDGLVIRSRVVRVTPRGECEAMCKQCKVWIPVPLRYDAGAAADSALRQDRRRAVI